MRVKFTEMCLLLIQIVLKTKSTTSKPKAFNGLLRRLATFISKQMVQQVFPGILIWLDVDAGVGPTSFCSERRSGPSQVTYECERPETLE
jgi:hypothetical protein